MKFLFLLMIFWCLQFPLLAQDMPDGRLAAGEAEGMQELGLLGGNQLLVQEHADYWKVVVISDELYVASLCLAGEAGVMVLHASAALGDLLFVPGEGTQYQAQGGFAWDMRETSLDEAAVRMRWQYYADHGWVANTMQMGERGVTEFVIKKGLLNGPHRLALGLMLAADPENTLSLPTEATGCGAHSLVSGDPEDGYVFRVGEWFR